MKELATQVARWGADQQLKHCADWLDGFESEGWAALQMCSDLRPKPLSLKKQALRLVSDYGVPFYRYTAEQTDTIRRALEALPDD